MAISFIIQRLIADDNMTPNHLLGIIVSGLTGGAIAGLLFIWLTGLFINPEALKIDLEEGETILFETGANYFKGVEAVGEKLYLTKLQPN